MLADTRAPAPAAAPARAPATVVSREAVRRVFVEKLVRDFRPGIAPRPFTVQYEVTGDAGGAWYLEVEQDRFHPSEGKHGAPEVTVTIAAEDWLGLHDGSLDGAAAFMSGKLQVAGDFELAASLGQVFPPVERGSAPRHPCQQIPVQHDDQRRARPPERRHPARAHQRAHAARVGGEAEQGDDGEGELEAQDHLRGDEEIGGAALAGPEGGGERGADGEGAGAEAAGPGAEADAEEAVHHGLAGEGAGEGSALPGGEQGHREDHARAARAEER